MSESLTKGNKFVKFLRKTILKNSFENLFLPFEVSFSLKNTSMPLTTTWRFKRDVHRIFWVTHVLLTYVLLTLHSLKCFLKNISAENYFRKKSIFFRSYKRFTRNVNYKQLTSHPAITCSKLTTKSLEQGVKYVSC